VAKKAVLTVNWGLVLLALEDPVDGGLRSGAMSDTLEGGHLAGEQLLATVCPTGLLVSAHWAGRLRGMGDHVHLFEGNLLGFHCCSLHQCFGRILIHKNRDFLSIRCGCEM